MFCLHTITVCGYSEQYLSKQTKADSTWYPHYVFSSGMGQIGTPIVPKKRRARRTLSIEFLHAYIVIVAFFGGYFSIVMLGTTQGGKWGLGIQIGQEGV